jgi:hypothetical protein
MLPSLDTHELTLRNERECNALHWFQYRYTVQLSILEKRLT